MLWIILISGALPSRPLLPIDETRYLAVAWEMWFSDNYLVPHLNGELYSHKPPLLFWLINLSWLLFGVNEITPRLIGPIFGLMDLFLVVAVARRLWPSIEAVRELAPVVLIGYSVWAFFTTLTLFDMLLSFFTLSGILGILIAREKFFWAGWFIVGVSLGGGLLSKGPVIFLHVLPLALLAPGLNLWRRRELSLARWYLGCGCSVLLGTVAALSWAIPAANSGGQEFANAIFWGQTAGRISHSFAHQAPVWWYLPFLPLLMIPWILWIPVWRSFGAVKTDTGIRFCLAWIIPVFIAFSCISGKRIHYLLPLLPGCAMLIARAISDLQRVDTNSMRWTIGGIISLVIVALFTMMHIGDQFNIPTSWSQINPGWGLVLFAVGVAIIVALRGSNNTIKAVNTLSLAMIVCLVLLHWAIFGVAGKAYDVTAFAKQLAHLQERGATIAIDGKYYGQFTFLGRLKKPLKSFRQTKLLIDWSLRNPDQYVVGYMNRKANPTNIQPIYQQDYRGKRLFLLQARDFARQLAS